MDMWGWSSEEAVRYLSITNMIGASIAAGSFGSVGSLAKKFEERKLLMFASLIPMIIARLIMIPMGNEFPPLYSNTTYPNGTPIFLMLYKNLKPIYFLIENDCQLNNKHLYF